MHGQLRGYNRCAMVNDSVRAAAIFQRDDITQLQKSWE